MEKPEVLFKQLESGRKLVRFDNIQDIFWYDNPENNPSGITIRDEDPEQYFKRNKLYFNQRNILTKRKRQIIDKAMKSMSTDKEFLEIVYKAKSVKRAYKLNRFGGNLSMPHYVTNSEKIFKKGRPGAKKVTLDMAFQVGTFVGHDYESSFVNILKTILMCQAMNINVNIDMFDSDSTGINNKDSYVICNVAKSYEKLDLKKILTCSHREFFNVTLFNGYSASGEFGHISGFLEEYKLQEDLSPMYDVIGGNTLSNPGETDEQQDMINRILKIGLHGRR